MSLGVIEQASEQMSTVEYKSKANTAKGVVQSKQMSGQCD